MLKKCVVAFGCLLVTAVAWGTTDVNVVAASSSVAFTLDSRAGRGPIETDRAETLRWSTLWDGVHGEGVAVSASLAQDGASLAEGLSGEGGRAWRVSDAGIYVLTHTSSTNGVAAAVETATFVVTGDGRGSGGTADGSDAGGSPDVNVVAASSSVAFTLDSRAGRGPIETDRAETLRWSTLWDGADAAWARVALAEDGLPFAVGLDGEGGRIWMAPDVGFYTLTHTTYTNGAAGAVESATFVVTGRPAGEGAGTDDPDAPASPALYRVVDLSGGTNAAAYPVSHLSAAPRGGWTDEHRTTKLVLRRVEAGTYRMWNRRPATLSKPFYVGVFEVTQRQWELVMGGNRSYYKGDARPVTNVSYDDVRGPDAGANWPASSAVDAASFLGVLRAKTGLDGFDLPTEAQWEYACRAGTDSRYNDGGDAEESLKTLGRYAGNTNDARGGHSVAHTTVGSYLPNAWGLYDMHGNVGELCRDWYGALSYGTDPAGLPSGTNRVNRGGTCSWKASSCTSFYRQGIDPSRRYSNEGFRLVCSVTDDEEGPTADVPFADGDVTVSGWSGRYDGVAHGVSVTLADGITDATVQYARVPDKGVANESSSVGGGGGSGTAVGDVPSPPVGLAWTATPPAFTDAGAYTVWCAIAAPGYLPVTNSATVSISPRTVTLTSGSASKTYDGLPVRCADIHVGGDGFVTGRGRDVQRDGFADRRGRIDQHIHLCAQRKHQGLQLYNRHNVRYARGDEGHDWRRRWHGRRGAG